MPIPQFPEAIKIEFPFGFGERWKTLINESEGGVEQRINKWLRPRRNWDCVAKLMERSAEADVLHNFFRARKGTFESFLFKTRDRRNWEKVFVAMGDGSRRVWQLPVTDWDFFTLYVDGTEKYWGPDYDVIFGVGQFGGALVVLRTAPAAGTTVECDAAKARLLVMVRFDSDIYEDEWVSPDGRYNARFRVVEEKKEIDPYL